jgi:hypothetical protein
MNTTSGTLGTVAPGQPMTAVADLVTTYKGKIDGFSYNISQDSVILSIEAASPMAALDMSKPHITSRDYQRKLNPSDSAFDYVYEGSKTITLSWGKEKDKRQGR